MVQVGLFRFMFDVISSCDTCKYDDDTYTASVHTILVYYYTSLAVCTCCACFANNMMMMYQQFSRICYVSPYGLGLVLLFCR